MKKIAFSLVCYLLSCPAYAHVTDTINVYFATGKSVITQGVKDQVSNFIYQDVLQTSQSVQIVGYTDYVGGNAYNDKLSRDRAQSVKRFLMSFGFAEKNITICIGKGKVLRENMSDKEGFARDRRVDIVTNAPPVTPPAAKEVPKPKPAPIKKQKEDDTELAWGGIQATQINQLKKDDVLVLKNLYFFPGRHVVKTESEPTLRNLFEALDENPSVKIRIEGHVCCVKGSASDALDFDTHEIALSVNRAKTVYDYLVKKGIDKERLSYKGFGASKRVAEEFNEEEADKNRRVEIRIQ